MQSNQTLGLNTKMMKPIVSLYDLSFIPSEVNIAFSKQQATTFDPNQILIRELAIAIQMNKIRQRFQDDVRKLYGIDAPKECLNRWLFQMCAQPTQGEQNLLFRKPEILLENLDNLEENVIGRELLLCVPYRLKSSYEGADRRKIIQEYDMLQQSAKSFIYKLQNDPANKGLAAATQLQKFKDKIFQFSVQYITEEKQAERLPQAQRIISEFNSQRFGQQIKDILKGLVDLVKSINQDFFDKSLLDESFQIKVTDVQGKQFKTVEEILAINDQEARIRFEIMPSTELDQSQQLKVMGFLNQLQKSDLQFQLNKSHVEKLHQLFIGKHHFYNSLLSLCRRYVSFFGNQFVFTNKENKKSQSFQEGTSFHAATPEICFNFMRKGGFSQELFASPFNCYFKQFCSAFFDTDQYFGSRGSFFDFVPISGYFECGPPYTEEVMNQTVQYCYQLLEEQTENILEYEKQCGSVGNKELCFILVVPDWRTPISEYITLLESDAYSKYMKYYKIAPSARHFFVCGDQQKNSQRYYQVPHGTGVYLMANTEAFSKLGDVGIRYLVDGIVDGMVNPTKSIDTNIDKK